MHISVASYKQVILQSKYQLTTNVEKNIFNISSNTLLLSGAMESSEKYQERLR